MKMSEKYPKYYKPVPKNTESLDVYAVCQMFPVDDATGCINHARKKLLVPGTRTGGKSALDDIREARDTLNRYLELHEKGAMDNEQIKAKLVSDTAVAECIAAKHAIYDKTKKEFDAKVDKAVASYMEEFNPAPPVFLSPPRNPKE